MATLTPAQLRALLPTTRNATYLNAAAASPIPLPVERAVAEHYRNAAEWGDVSFPVWLHKREQIRAQLARFIGAGADEVALLSSTSMGFNVAAGILKAKGVREVVTLATEFPSSTLPLLGHGLKLRLVRPRPDGSFALQDVEAAVGPQTGALVASAVQYASGFRLDLAGASRLCRDRKLLFFVNGAQALGQIPIDVAKSGIDLLAGTSHKWMMGGYGVGLFYARRELLAEAGLPQVGWLSVPHPFAMDPVHGASVVSPPGATWFEAEGASFARTAASLEAGCSALGIHFGLGAALELHEQVGIETTAARNAELQRILREGLRARGFVPNLPDDKTAGICVFPVEGDAKGAVAALLKEKVVVTPRGGGVRVSTHVYNDEEDLERLLAAFDRIGLRPAAP